MYKTNQRNIIMEFLKESKEKHITVDDVLFYLKGSGNSVGKTTVYRYFDILQKEGSLRKFENIDGKSACYQYINDTERCGNHYHLVCESCNELFHIDCDFLDEVKNHILQNHLFQINNSKTVFHGLCKKCIVHD